MTQATAETDRFTFDEGKHEYRLDGVRLPSVTEVLEQLGFIEPQFYTEEGRRRGLDVHYFCQYLDEGDYDPAAAKARGVDGYVESWRKFKEQAEGLKLLEIESRLYHPLYRFAGSPDRRVFLRGTEQIWDLKSGAPEDWHGYQTAAYEMLFAKHPRGQRPRGGVHLQADGSLAKFKAHTDLNDGNYFIAFLTTYQRRLKHGIGNQSR